MAARIERMGLTIKELLRTIAVSGRCWTGVAFPSLTVLNQL